MREILASEGISVDRPLFALAPHRFFNRGRYFDSAYAGFGIEYDEMSDAVLDQYYDALVHTADRLARQGTVVIVRRSLVIFGSGKSNKRNMPSRLCRLTMPYSVRR